MGDRTPAVSVIIPSHNRERYLSRAIRSVLEQTHRDFELLVVDDGSTDNTRATVASLADSRIRYLRLSRNRGAACARNRGVAESRGEYVAFLDSDDEWLPAKLEKQLDLFHRSSPRVGLIYTGAHCSAPGTRPYRRHPRHSGDVHGTLLRRNIVSGSTSSVMIRRHVFESVGGFDESLPARQDRDLWLRISRHHEFDFVRECLVRLDLGTDRERITSNHESFLRGWALFLDKHRELLRRERVLHLYLRWVGRAYQGRLRDMVAARRWYVESLKTQPLGVPSYLFFLTTLLPRPLYGVALASKRLWDRAGFTLRRALGVC